MFYLILDADDGAIKEVLDFKGIKKMTEGTADFYEEDDLFVSPDKIVVEVNSLEGCSDLRDLLDGLPEVESLGTIEEVMANVTEKGLEWLER